MEQAGLQPVSECGSHEAEMPRRADPPGEHKMACGGGSKETRGELRTSQGRGEGPENTQRLQCPEVREGQGVARASEAGRRGVKTTGLD